MTYEDDEDVVEPPQVRRLRVLVMVLMVVLILGIVTIAVTIVIRLGIGGAQSVPPLAAEQIVLPEGATITGLGQGTEGLLVSVTKADGSEWLRIHDAASGQLLRETAILRE
ncbi:MAG: DUF6476 family protein [Pseudomonadota bacterium]